MTRLATLVPVISAIAALFVMAPAKAATIAGQGPCAYTGGTCVSFSPPQVPPVIRTFTFKMPAAGQALVQFNGTMQCYSSATAADEVVDIAAQIVTSPDAVAVYTEPGGGRYAMRIQRRVSPVLSYAINLTQSRVITYASGGFKSVFFKFNLLRMDPHMACLVSAAAFNVVTQP